LATEFVDSAGGVEGSVAGCGGVWSLPVDALSEDEVEDSCVAVSVCGLELEVMSGDSVVVSLLCC